MILDYNVGDEVNYYVYLSGRQVPGRILVVHHEDDGQPIPYTYIKIKLYNELIVTCYEPEIKACVRKRSNDCTGTCSL